MSIKLVTLDEVTVSTPGDRVALSQVPIIAYSVAIQGYYTNTGYAYFGDHRVSSSNGHVFEASDVMELEGPMIGREQEEFDISELYLDASVANSKFRISVIVKS